MWEISLSAFSFVMWYCQEFSNKTASVSELLIVLYMSEININLLLINMHVLKICVD
jgi:hypothetical protein